MTQTAFNTGSLGPLHNVVVIMINPRTATRSVPLRVMIVVVDPATHACPWSNVGRFWTLARVWGRCATMLSAPALARLSLVRSALRKLNPSRPRNRMRQACEIASKEKQHFFFSFLFVLVPTELRMSLHI